MPKGGIGAGVGTPAGAGGAPGGGLADMLGGSSPMVNILRAMSGVQRWGGGGQNPAPLVPQAPGATAGAATPPGQPSYLHYQPPPQFVRQPLTTPAAPPTTPVESEEDWMKKRLQGQQTPYQDYNNVGA